MSVWIIIGFLGTVAIFCGVVLIGRHVIMGWHLSTIGNALIATGAVGAGYWPTVVAALVFIALNFCNAAKWRRERAPKEPKFWTSDWETAQRQGIDCLYRKNDQLYRRWTYRLQAAGHEDHTAMGRRLAKEIRDRPPIGRVRLSPAIWDHIGDVSFGALSRIKVEYDWEGLEARWDYWIPLDPAQLPTDELCKWANKVDPMPDQDRRKS